MTAMRTTMFINRVKPTLDKLVSENLDKVLGSLNANVNGLEKVRKILDDNGYHVGHPYVYAVMMMFSTHINVVEVNYIEGYERELISFINDLMMTNPEREMMEHQQNMENEFQERLQDMYTYSDSGFCDGFTKY